ncbi:hypothetical protein V1524DRAFT_472090 [Lipomyces starkeyi]
MDDFNSSDIEFEPAVSKNSGRQLGRASIAQIIEASDIDRLTSKRAVKQHVELLLDGEPKFENLRAQIKIEFAKGSKNVRNKELEFYLRPLGDPRYRHMCTVSLLMIHALRHGLVVGSTIQEVLEHASNAADGRVVWTFPDRPVLCAFTKTGVKRCELDKPADTQQLRLSVKQMGIVSNILTRVYTHATRLGAAQDVAHLPQAEGLGFTTNEVRQSLGHHNKAFQRGITEVYAAKREFSSLRARSLRKRFETGKTATSRSKGIGTRRAREDALSITFAASVKRSSSRPPRQRQRRGAKSASEVNVIASFVGSHQERQVGNETTGAGSSISPDSGNQSSTTVSAIDPRPLDGDVLDDSCVDTNEFERLDKQLFGKATSHGNNQPRTDFDSVALFEEQRMESSSADKVQITASEFVSAYASINVVDNIWFARAWPNYVNGKTPFAEGIGHTL